MPTISTHVPKDWPHWAALRARLGRFRGKPGPYIRDLLERDLRRRAVLFKQTSPAAQNRWSSLVESERGDASRKCAAGADFLAPIP